MNDRGELLAKIVLLFVLVAALNAWRRGELGSWLAAKFVNAGSGPENARGDSFARIGSSSSSSGSGAIGGIVGADSEPANLVPVGSTRLSARFAARWLPLAAAAARDGVLLDGGGYRSSEEQARLRRAHCKHPDTDPASACNPPTAPVGSSRHETGDAIDVHLSGPGGRRSPEYRWLSAHAGSFGVYNLPSEPWHWSIDGK